MDPRLEHRRRRVTEDRARSNLVRLVRVLVFVGVLGGLIWFAQSPFMSVAEVSVSGASRVDVRGALASRDVIVGRPMLLLDIDGAESVLLENPWVAQAEVARDWPTTIVVRLVERVPAASALFSDGWWLMAADGTALAAAAGPAPDLGVAEFENVGSGQAAESLDVTGAVEFLDAIPPQRRPGTTIRLGGEGLEAVVAGFTVRLGRPFDMGEKADVALAVIDDGLDEGSIITVVAPASPAVLPPRSGSDPPPGGGEGDEGGSSSPTTQP